MCQHHVFCLFIYVYVHLTKIRCHRWETKSNTSERRLISGWNNSDEKRELRTCEETIEHLWQDRKMYRIFSKKCQMYSPPYHGATAPPPQWARASSLPRLDDHTQTHYTWQDSSGRVISPSQRPVPDNRQTCMSAAGFEPTIPASKRPQTHTLDRAAIWIGESHV